MTSFKHSQCLRAGGLDLCYYLNSFVGGKGSEGTIHGTAIVLEEKGKRSKVHFRTDRPRQFFPTGFVQWRHHPRRENYTHKCVKMIAWFPGTELRSVLCEPTRLVTSQSSMDG